MFYSRLHYNLTPQWFDFDSEFKKEKLREIHFSQSSKLVFLKCELSTCACDQKLHNSSSDIVFLKDFTLEHVSNLPTNWNFQNWRWLAGRNFFVQYTYYTKIIFCLKKAPFFFKKKREFWSNRKINWWRSIPFPPSLCSEFCIFFSLLKTPSKWKILLFWRIKFFFCSST